MVSYWLPEEAVTNGWIGGRGEVCIGQRGVEDTRIDENRVTARDEYTELASLVG